MTAPTAGEPVTDRTNALLTARVEELSAAYDWMREQAARIHRELGAVTGRAESPDGVVSATVGPRGKLASLTLDPRGSRRLSSEKLAAAIVETVNRAAGDANARTAALIAPIVPEGMSATELLDGSVDPSSWQPRQPLTESTFDSWWSRIRKDNRPEAR